ncbi:hypothetical protein C8Q74DRAFT_594934 [Fomes fomentarius]|nr:hypothetical protein C8Q74DRAFT_594934 [Fomes fomentarius]
MNSCSPVSMPLFWFLTPSHANHLFEIFYDMFNIHCPVLDPEVHTVPFTIARCPTLFTLVCTLASRCDASAASLYAMIVNETKRVAQRALLSDSRSMELARAYILMASYDGDATIGGRDQRLYLKIAIRIVHSLTVHLDYHSRPRTDDEERERVNKERLWLMCYILDRSSTIGFDRKPEIMEDEIIRYSANWYKGSVMNVNSDIRISAHVQLLRLLSQFCDTVYTKSSPMSIEQNIDVSAMAYNYQEQLDRLHEELEERFLQDTDFTETAEAFNFSLLTFLVDYSKLIIWSTASLHRPNPCMAEKCYRCAKAVILRMVDILAPTGYMKSSPNVIFLQATAAAAYLAKSRTAEVLSLLTRLATCFSSPHVALDDLHTPAIHACHLAAIVQDLTHCHGPATTGSKYPHDNLTFDTTNLSGQEFFPMHITT